MSRNGGEKIISDSVNREDSEHSDSPASVEFSKKHKKHKKHKHKKHRRNSPD